jgi:hypothetical protein
MMMVGLGASTCATGSGRAGASRNNEVTTTTVPAGTSRVPRDEYPRTGWLRKADQAACSVPHAKVVPSVQIQ